MRAAVVAVFFGLSLCLSGCNQITEEKVRKDFIESNPRAAIVKIEPSEGNDDSVYYVIYFRPRNTKVIRKETWLYTRDNSGWKVVNRNVRESQ